MSDPTVTVPATGPAGKPRILLAEDDPALAEMLKWLLTKEGFETLHAADGLTALNLARQHRPNLILSDVMLPKMDGFKLCRFIKFDAELKGIPFVFLTARTQDKDKETAREAGANAYITKPIPNAELVKAVRQYLA